MMFLSWLVVVSFFDSFVGLISSLVSSSQYNSSIFIWVYGDNARYILSALCQAQAAIFGIFFTLIFIITQVQVQNKGASPYDMRLMLKSKTLYFIFFVFRRFKMDTPASIFIFLN